MGRRVIKKREGTSTEPMRGDPAFDRWVARQLHKIYDEVLSEEIPEELLRLMDRLGEAADGNSGVLDDTTASDGKTRRGPPRGR